MTCPDVDLGPNLDGLLAAHHSLIHATTFCRIAEALSTGIWDDAAFANYVAIVEHGSSKMVGILEGLYGTTTLLVALPFGTLADRWRRDRVLRICGVLELGAPSSRQLIEGLL